MHTAAARNAALATLAASAAHGICKHGELDAGTGRELDAPLRRPGQRPTPTPPVPVLPEVVQLAVAHSKGTAAR
jgi:hypothetical protein